MISTLLMALFSIFFDLLAILRTSKSETALEILIPRQQVRILQRKPKTPPRISDPERMVLASLPGALQGSDPGLRFLHRGDHLA